MEREKRGERFVRARSTCRRTIVQLLSSVLILRNSVPASGSPFVPQSCPFSRTRTDVEVTLTLTSPFFSDAPRGSFTCISTSVVLCCHRTRLAFGRERYSRRRSAVIRELLPLLVFLGREEESNATFVVVVVVSERVVDMSRLPLLDERSIDRSPFSLRVFFVMRFFSNSIAPQNTSHPIYNSVSTHMHTSIDKMQYT